MEKDQNDSYLDLDFNMVSIYSSESVIDYFNPKTKKCHQIKGMIKIGNFNTFEEFSKLEYKSNESLEIGDFNYFGIGCHIAAKKIGSNNRFETKCVVKSGVIIGNGVVIGPGVVVQKNIEIPDGTILYGINGYNHQKIKRIRNTSIFK